MPEATRLCEYCRTVDISQKQRNARFCSPICQSRAKRGVKLPEDRPCLHCGVIIPATARSYQKYCNPACKVAANIDSIRESNRNGAARRRAGWSDERREYNREWQAKWRSENRDVAKRQNRAYYLANKERFARDRDQWRKDNPERFAQMANEHAARRRARKLGGGSLKVTARDWRRICALHRWACAYCGASGCTLTMDHVVPLARGGRHAIGNLAPACDRCNKSKGKLFLSEWRWRDAVEAERAG